MATTSTQAREAVTTREPGDESEHESFAPQRGWKHDNAAGVEWLNYTDTRNEVFEFWLKFRDGKPSDKVRTYMKDNGFHWEGQAPSGGHWPEVKGAWVMPIRRNARSQDRLHGERVFEKLVEMICEEKGIALTEKTGGTPF